MAAAGTHVQPLACKARMWLKLWRTSSNSFYGSAGSWRFEVQGKDAAGNAAAQNLLAEWTVDMDSGEEHVRLAAGPYGPTANTTAQFSLLVVTDLTFHCLSYCARHY